MRKGLFTSSDSEYFEDKEDAIKLEHCVNGGKVCKSQMLIMNSNLLLARKLIDNKDYKNALTLINEAFDSTYGLQENQCLPCANLFRNTIKNTLVIIVDDLTKMTKGFFVKKRYKTDLLLAEKLLTTLMDK